MDRVGLISLSWQHGGTDALGRFTVPQAERGDWLESFCRDQGLDEAVYLATCNRVELSFVSDGHTPLPSYRPRLFAALTGREPAAGEAERSLKIWGGEGAAEHLFLVASGLASARVGEVEIANQLRQAYDLARARDLTGTRLDLVFDHAFKVSRRVQNETSLRRGRQSLSWIALAHMRARLERTPGAAAVIGVSPMTEHCARHLAADGARVLVVNRTLARAATLAAEIGGDACSLAEFRARPAPVETLVSATGSTEPVLARATLERLAARTPSGEPPLIVDMAIPADVDPAAARLAGVDRVAMEDITAEAEQSRERRLAEAPEARAIVDEELDALRRLMNERTLAPLFAAIQRRYRQTADEGVERLFRRELKTLGDDEREAVRRWAETLARRFAHLPTTGLRAVANASGSTAVRAFLADADEHLLELLAEAERGDGPRLPGDDE